MSVIMRQLGVFAVILLDVSHHVKKADFACCIVLEGSIK